MEIVLTILVVWFAVAFLCYAVSTFFPHTPPKRDLTSRRNPFKGGFR